MLNTSKQKTQGYLGLALFLILLAMIGFVMKQALDVTETRKHIREAMFQIDILRTEMRRAHVKDGNGNLVGTYRILDSADVLLNAPNDTNSVNGSDRHANH